MSDRPNGPGVDPDNLPHKLGAWIKPKEEKDPRRIKLRHFLETPQRTRAFYKPCNPLDQYQTSSCVGHSGRHYQLSEPYPAPVQWGEYDKVTTLEPSHWPSVENYFGAQRDDPWPGGEYPGASPRYEGSSLTGLAKYFQEIGVIDGAYGWAETPDEVTQTLLTIGPVMCASLWTRDMFYPDEQGYIHATGPEEGGHAYYIFGAEESKDWYCLQSWGDWGLKNQSFTDVNGKNFTVPTGVFKIAPADQEKLFANHDAEAFAPIKLLRQEPYYPALRRYSYLIKSKWSRQECIIVDTQHKELGYFKPRKMS